MTGNEDLTEVNRLASGLFDLSGRVALVTGGAGWLGYPMSLALARAGCHVIMAGRNAQRLQDMQAAAEQQGLCLDFHVCDIACSDSAATVMADLGERHGRLDILVNNAAGGAPGPRGLDAPAEAFVNSANVNLAATWRLINLALPWLRQARKRTGDASVINIASMYGKVSPVPMVYEMTGEPPNPAYYGAAKAGLLQMTRWLACHLGKERIRVNAISPGPFPQWNARERAPDFVAQLDARTVMDRVGERHEIMGAVVFLASPSASFITGADLAVDGGWTAW